MNKSQSYDTIISPLVTEKTMLGMSDLKYSFKVKKDACKVEIRNAVEKIFNVKVSKVNTMNVRGRNRRRGKIIGRTPDWKKAVVTLAKGQKSIEFFNQLT